MFLLDLIRILIENYIKFILNIFSNSFYCFYSILVKFFLSIKNKMLLILYQLEDIYLKINQEFQNRHILKYNLLTF